MRLIPVKKNTLLHDLAEYYNIGVFCLKLTVLAPGHLDGKRLNDRIWGAIENCDRGEKDFKLDTRPPVRYRYPDRS